ncbi:DNA-binding protein [Metabacillus halosaccharovorans]|uniref:DNA-binding protein n=1 Tax=Metabacillus halosaccharovorans TaxID=930124 RepID=A0ABT3DHZ7_9BACI|nr:DNA-binding protein [Metabacillus halosaccharovorans]MCV9886272.1 DNA-binding protein [Metabacillus halosaccharovorans]
MITLDKNAFREMFSEIIKEEVAKALQDFRTTQLPPMLTRQQFMDLLNIKQAKASELLNRPDFPVFREAGVLVPTHMLFKWIEKNTRWVEENTDYFQKRII